MKLSSKIFAGILLGFGLPISMMGTIQALDAKAAPSDREGAVAALVLFGLPPTALGSWLIWSGMRTTRTQERDRLRQAFFRLLEENSGTLTVIRFSMETGLEGQEAKAYLDERAREFNALYNITEEGNFSYQFNLGEAARPTVSELPQIAQPPQPPLEIAPAELVSNVELAEGGTANMDVILAGVDPSQKIAVLKVLRELTGLGLRDAKEMIEATPVSIARGINAAKAKRYKKALEDAGAEVMVISQARGY
jgi:ribosomal protein L7/L12